MEAIMGIIVLMQVVILIQIMLRQKKMLQKFCMQEEKIEAILKKEFQNIGETEAVLEESVVGEEKTNSVLSGGSIRENNGYNIQKKTQEALINEVLSEVFS